MKDGICPKCQSEEVYIDSGVRHGIMIPIHTFTPHQTHLYVCADCGYLEFYAQTGQDLSKVKERFRKVKR
jgi:predicted nucleic-acid-binding Zn-ribbon protein